MKYFIGTTLNFVCPGLGDVLYGKLAKGLFTFVSFILSLGLMYYSYWLIIIPIAIWFYGIMSIFNSVEEG